jgi:hypothetical protein
MNWYKHATVTIAPKEDTSKPSRNETMMGIKANLQKQLEDTFLINIHPKVFTHITLPNPTGQPFKNPYDQPTGTLQIEIELIPSDKLNEFIETTKRILTQMNLEYDDDMHVTSKIVPIRIDGRTKEIPIKIFTVNIVLNHNASEEMTNINNMFEIGSPTPLNMTDDVARKLFDILQIEHDEIFPLVLMDKINKFMDNSNNSNELSQDEFVALQKLYEMAQLSFNYDVQLIITRS